MTLEIFPHTLKKRRALKYICTYTRNMYMCFKVKTRRYKDIILLLDYGIMGLHFKLLIRKIISFKNSLLESVGFR